MDLQTINSYGCFAFSQTKQKRGWFVIIAFLFFKDVVPGVPAWQSLEKTGSEEVDKLVFFKDIQCKNSSHIKVTTGSKTWRALLSLWEGNAKQRLRFRAPVQPKTLFPINRSYNHRTGGSVHEGRGRPPFEMAVFQNWLHLCQCALTQTWFVLFLLSPLIEGKGIVSEETNPGVSRSPLLLLPPPSVRPSRPLFLFFFVKKIMQFT